MNEREMLEAIAQLAEEVASLKKELKKTQLSAIMVNPIMYDEETRKAAQVELQAIIDAELAPKLADLFK